jgi:hypothetical protein
MEQYFITIHENMPKNKLEKQLQAAFKGFNNNLIHDTTLSILKKTYHEVLGDYLTNKGKSFVDYSSSQYDDIIFISMGTSLQIHLTRVKGIVGGF